MSIDTIPHLAVAPGIQVMSRKRHWSEPWRTRKSKTRIFLDIQNESFADNWMNRTARPVSEWGKLLRKQVLPALGMEGITIRWSQNAGCAMCPCSPGWIVDGYLVAEDASADNTDDALIFSPKNGDYGNVAARDVWVRVDLEALGIPAYVNDERRLKRLIQVGAINPEGLTA